MGGLSLLFAWLVEEPEEKAPTPAVQKAVTGLWGESNYRMCLRFCKFRGLGPRCFREAAG